MVLSLLLIFPLWSGSCPLFKSKFLLSKPSLVSLLLSGWIAMHFLRRRGVPQAVSVTLVRLGRLRSRGGKPVGDRGDRRRISSWGFQTPALKPLQLLPGLGVRALAGCEESPRPAWELATGGALFIIPGAHGSAST